VQNFFFIFLSPQNFFFVFLSFLSVFLFRRKRQHCVASLSCFNQDYCGRHCFAVHWTAPKSLSSFTSVIKGRNFIFFIFLSLFSVLCQTSQQKGNPTSINVWDEDKRIVCASLFLYWQHSVMYCLLICNLWFFCRCEIPPLYFLLCVCVIWLVFLHLYSLGNSPWRTMYL